MPGSRERPLQVGGALLVGPGQVAVHLAVVRPEDHRVARATRSTRSPARSRSGSEAALAGATTAIVAFSGRAGGLTRSTAIAHPRDRLADQLGRTPPASRARARRGARRPRRARSGPVRVEPERDARCTGAGSRRRRPARRTRAATRRGSRRGSARRTSPGRRRAGRSAPARGPSVSARISLSVTNASRRWRPWKTTCSRTAAASFSAGRGVGVHRGDHLLGQAVHEVVLEADQDRLLRRVPVVDRGRLDLGRGGDRAHRRRVVAEPREELDRGGVDRLARLGAARAAGRQRPARRRLPRGQPRCRSSLVWSWVATSRPSVFGEPDGHLDQRRVRGRVDALARCRRRPRDRCGSPARRAAAPGRASAGGGGRCR